MLIHSKNLRQIKRDIPLYLFILPGFLAILIFNYVPLYGIQMAFKTFRMSLGIMGSPWIGFDNFTRLFKSPQFPKILGNTLILSFYGLIAGFPIPILLALVLNSCFSKKLKKTVQMITYAPHFISMVVMVGIINIMFSTTAGPVNMIIKMAGGQPVHFVGLAEAFRHLFVWTGIWQNMGWSSIIYMAALSTVDQEIHEAAIVDGATKVQRIIHIDFPSILPTAVILLILNSAHIMNVGFEKTYLMQNSMNLSVSEVISTYVYKVGLRNFDFGFSTAIGLFNNVLNCFMLLLVNTIARKVGETSLF